MGGSLTVLKLGPWGTTVDRIHNILVVRCMLDIRGYRKKGLGRATHLGSRSRENLLKLGSNFVSLLLHPKVTQEV